MANTGFRALGASVALTLLAGCGVTRQAQDGMPPVAPPGALAQAPRGNDLLYASSIYNCDVNVFTYPRGKLVQTINSCAFGFGPAFGLCTDKSGNVFMAMGEGFSIFEFAHGGSEPIAQLENDSILPVGCSVDPNTGDLGVASATGNVAIFKHGSSTPQLYGLPDVSEFFFCTFDDRGNLFVDGEHNDSGRTFALAELPKGGSALREIKAPGKVGTGFALQWDGRHLIVGQRQGLNAFALARMRVSGSAAKIVGTTRLASTPNTFTPFQFWIQGGTVIQPENANAEIGFWNYPRGGEQVKEISIDGYYLVGVTVSVAPRIR